MGSPIPTRRKAAQQVYQQAMNDRAKQAAARTILRALYAPDQLRERMAWFWFNHFNVHQYKANIRILIGDYQDPRHPAACARQVPRSAWSPRCIIRRCCVISTMPTTRRGI
jgi:hypothetical protein